MVRKRRWSFKDDRRLMELAHSSKSLEEVVKETHRSSESIKKARLAPRGPDGPRDFCRLLNGPDGLMLFLPRVALAKLPANAAFSLRRQA
jgi:hypothetical protein